MIAERIKSQLRMGVLEYCAMQILHRGEVYASDIIEELLAARLISVEGVIYPLLIRFKNEGLVKYDWVNSDNGLPKKHYSLTENGINTVLALNQTWDELQATTEGFRQKSTVISPSDSNTTTKK